MITLGGRSKRVIMRLSKEKTMFSLHSQAEYGLVNLACWQRLTRYLDRLAALYIDNEPFIDCLILNLCVRLDIAQTRTRQRIIGRVTNNAERKGTV